MKSEAEWVIVTGPGGLCRRCGATVDFGLAVGQEVDVFLKLCNDFVDDHMNCLEVYPYPGIKS